MCPAASMVQSVPLLACVHIMHLHWDACTWNQLGMDVRYIPPDGIAISRAMVGRDLRHRMPAAMHLKYKWEACKNPMNVCVQGSDGMAQVAGREGLRRACL